MLCFTVAHLSAQLCTSSLCYPSNRTNTWTRCPATTLHHYNVKGINMVLTLSKQKCSADFSPKRRGVNIFHKWCCTRFCWKLSATSYRHTCKLRKERSSQGNTSRTNEYTQTEMVVLTVCNSHLWLDHIQPVVFILPLLPWRSSPKCDPIKLCYLGILLRVNSDVLVSHLLLHSSHFMAVLQNTNP